MEFEFDFPFEPSESVVQSIMSRRCISYELAYNTVYQEQWKWRRRQLQLETRCLSSMVERLLPKFKCKFWKVVVELVTTPTYISPRNLLGVCVVQHEFNLEWYNSQTDLNKLIYLTDCAESSILQIEKEVPNIYDYFSLTFSKIRSYDYDNIWTWGKKIHSSQKRYSAYVQITHTMKSVTASVIIEDRKMRNSKKVEIFSEIPDERVYAKHLGRLEFINETALQMLNKSSGVVFVVDLPF